MNRVEKERRPLRAAFTKHCTTVEEILELGEPDHDQYDTLLRTLVDKYQRLEEIQVKFADLMLEEDIPEDKFEADFQVAEAYRERFIALRARLERVLPNVPSVAEGSIVSARNNVDAELNDGRSVKSGSIVSSRKSVATELNDVRSVKSGSSSSASLAGNRGQRTAHRRFKLPPLQLKSFNGDTADWLSFWGQYKQIHEDQTMPPEDKFQYLSQCMAPNSKAKTLVDSYPPTAENYPLAVAQLKERFARDELVVEVYIRRLIGLVLENNQQKGSDKEIPSLYDRLESYLRALETLGKPKEQLAEFLTPLVESCLPERLLRLWQRSSDSQSVVCGGLSKLDKLMDFLKREVQNEERIAIVRDNFGCRKQKEDLKKKDTKKPVREATAAALVNTASKESKHDKVLKCVFCGKTHQSSNCFKARDMTKEEKSNALSKGNCCFTCLIPGHQSKQCKTTVSCILCRKRHYPVMCPELALKRDSVKEEKKNEETKSQKAEKGIVKDNVLSSKLYTSEVMLQTLVISVKSGDRETLARCVLDTGSQRSYITTSLVNRLKSSPIAAERVVHGLFGGAYTAPSIQNVHRVTVTSLSKDFESSMIFLEQSKICGQVPVLSYKERMDLLRKENIDIVHHAKAPLEIEVLLGADVVGKIMTGRIQQTESDLVAVHTRFGWTVMGQASYEKTPTGSTVNLLVRDFLTEKLWSLDAIGIQDPIVSKKAKERQEAALENFQKTVTVTENGRYQVSLPFKENHVVLPSYRALTWQRHQGMMKRLSASGLLPDYIAVFNDWEQMGMIEEVPTQDLDKEACYLPHRPVLKGGSTTTKIRPVFDASAKVRGEVSLNECLEKGANLIELIPEILDRFRQRSVAFVADIEKAFLQLEVKPEHRDYLRFIHPTGKIYRHCRVVFGVNASPFLLGAVLLYHLKQMENDYPVTVKLLLRAFYVDNVVASVDTAAEFVKAQREAIELMGRAHMNLRSWASNVDTAPPQVGDSSVPVLGLLWDIKSDTLSCDVSRIKINRQGSYTKRKMLSIVQKIFDPLGFVSPCLLIPKILIQEAWVKGLTWDEILPESIQIKFTKWAEHIADLNKLKITRWAKTAGACQLHVFVDASKHAYAACIFSRIEVEGEVQVTLVRAKTRLAPTGDIVIARLELMACVMAARLLKSIITALNPSEFVIRLWSDSTIALWWIKDDSGDTFVRNRVREIRALTDPHSWHHIPGERNPADLLSRGCTIQKMLKSKWWNGPPWLKLPQSEWPTGAEIEPKNDSEQSNVLLVEQARIKEMNPILEIEAANFNKLVRIVAWLFRFISNSKNPQGKSKSSHLTFNEISKAKNTLFYLIQQEVYSRLGRPFPTEVVLDASGLARVKLNITARKDDIGFLCPILLPGKHKIVKSLVRSMHHEYCHAGFNMLWSLLRRQFWIVGARCTIKSVIRDCISCRRHKRNMMQTPPAMLPLSRVQDSAVFETTGVDLAGPLILKGGQKLWVVIFTCAVYRAVHFEAVTSLSADAFLQCLKRFVARRGKPKIIYSDNATNFRRTTEDLSKADWSKVVEQQSAVGIEWRFNAPLAPWWGGWWERVVRILKDLLRKTLGRASLTHDEKITTLCETESIINGRPLSYFDENDVLIPLTPAAFLQDIQDSGIPVVETVDGARLRKRVRYRKLIADELRRRFRDEYLGQLKSVYSKKRMSDHIRIGDIVLVSDEARKRIMWPLAKVIELYPGKDGIVRTVKVKTAKGVYIRPVQQLVSMEISDIVPGNASAEENIENKEGSNSEHKPREYRTRSGRLVKTPERLDLLDQVLYKWKF